MNRISITAFISILSFLFTACSKSDDDVVKPEETPGVSTGVYSVSNVVADTTATSSGAATTLYYSLESNKVIPAAQVQTDNWDLAFTGTYNSSVYVNNGKSQYSPGYGGPGKGAIYLVLDTAVEKQYYDAAKQRPALIPDPALFNQAFDNIRAAVEDAKFRSYPSVELDHFMGTDDGWAWYDFYGELFPDRPADEKAHVAYALPRPLIIRTAKGNYAKVVIYSLYRSAPANPDRSYKPGYLTFKYAIQKDGSRNLAIQ